MRDFPLHEYTVEVTVIRTVLARNETQAVEDVLERITPDDALIYVNEHAWP